jgi:hypothetical protein
MALRRPEPNRWFYYSGVDLRGMLQPVRSLGYAHRVGKDQPAQQHLWAIAREPPATVPIGLRVRVSGSGRSLPVVPWIALLDPDVTTTAQKGLYVVYLYHQSLATVYLSMNQGVTQHRQNARDAGLTGVAADRAALAEIRAETALIRGLLAPSDAADTVDTIALGGATFLPHAYEAGSIAAIGYALNDLPGEEQLADDLRRFGVLYATCVELKAELVATDPNRVRTAARTVPLPTVAGPPMFRPKSAADYLAEVPAQHQRKERRHEALIERFGHDLIANGLSPSTAVHPRDLTVSDPGGHEWLIEAKMVSRNAEDAVRQVIGQLMAYRHFYYRKPGLPEPRLLGLFSEPIGDAFVALLDSLDIAAAWLTNDGWQTTRDAVDLLPTTTAVAWASGSVSRITLDLVP